MWLLHSPILSSSPPYPIAVTVHQHDKMPQSHYLSLCYTVYSVTLHTMCANHNTAQSPSPSLPIPSPHSLPFGDPSWSLWVCCCFVPSVLLCCYTPQMSEIIWYLSFSSWLISLSIIPSNSRVGFLSFLWLNSIPLCICTTSSLSIHLLMDTWVASMSCWNSKSCLHEIQISL